MEPCFLHQKGKAFLLLKQSVNNEACYCYEKGYKSQHSKE